MDPQYIIVQAGGKGSRMESLTRNKPKALVPVDNLPILFHLFRKYPLKNYIIIGDYKYDVLEKYLNTFAEVHYTLVRGTGHTGTCAGLPSALALIPDGESFVLTWCDLVLPKEYGFPEQSNHYIGISKDFYCRWSYVGGTFKEERSDNQGVAGYFIFKDKSDMRGVPEDGEFVRWLKDRKIKFEELPLFHAREYGIYREWEKLPKMRCRPFNRMEAAGDKLYKIPVDSQGELLAGREEAWYKKLQSYPKWGGVNIPHIYGYSPLCLERVDGKNIYEYGGIPYSEKRAVLDQLIRSIRSIHQLESVPADKGSYYEAYIGKTKSRLDKVRDLIPFADDRTVLINGKSCRNIFYNWDELENLVMKYLPKTFKFIHGDCTFSNILLKSDKTPVLIDPRGYFGNSEFYGDAAYDWVKLYYSLSSNYDQFNLKHFSLDIGGNRVEFKIASNNWEDMEDDFFALLGGEVGRKQMKLFLAVIWLSLTTYAWEDYDSICGAFYQGLYCFEEALLMSDDGVSDEYFSDTVHILADALQNLDKNQFEKLIEESESTLRRGNKIITSGLGKNVPVCDKFTGTMLSLGLNANFLHTNSAVHGDLGMVKSGDLVIILTKSGNTSESVYLAKLLKQRKGVAIWLLTFNENSNTEKIAGKNRTLVINMEHEGDMWNMVPNNSTTLNLIILQGLSMTLAKRMHLDLNRDFKPNHPGGAIGEMLKDG